MLHVPLGRRACDRAVVPTEIVQPCPSSDRGCRAVAPAWAPTRFSGTDDGDGLDLDHEIGSGETRNADGRAGRGRPRWVLTRLSEFTGYLRDFRKLSPGATPEIGATLRIPALISSHQPLSPGGTARVADREDCDEESRIEQDINMGEILGRVMTVAGSQITVNPEADRGWER
jgi:hypothetical protein